MGKHGNSPKSLELKVVVKAKDVVIYNKAAQVKRTNDGESDESAPKRKRGRPAKK